MCCMGAKNAIPLDTLARWGETKASLLCVLHASVALLCSNLMLLDILACPGEKVGLPAKAIPACAETSAKPSERENATPT